VCIKHHGSGGKTTGLVYYKNASIQWSYRSREREAGREAWMEEGEGMME
jgi:hypothetical protein